MVLCLALVIYQVGVDFPIWLKNMFYFEKSPFKM